MITKQARWQDFLVKFHNELQYKPGRVNSMVDALSRKAELAISSHAQGTLMNRTTEGTHDPQAKTILTFVNDGRTRKFWTEDGLLYVKGSHIYVPYGRGIQGCGTHSCSWKNATVGHIYGRMWSLLCTNKQSISACTKETSSTIAHS